MYVVGQQKRLPEVVRNPTTLPVDPVLDVGVHGKRQSHSMKTFCQLGEGDVEEEAILEPISLVDLKSKGVSRITNGTTIGTRDRPDGASVGCSIDLEVSCGLLRPWGAGRGGCYRGANCPPGRKWSIVIFFWTTFSISDSSDSVYSTGMGTTTPSSSIGICSTRL